MPQFYLREFRDRDGRLHAHNKKSGAFYRAKPVDVAFMMDFHRPLSGPSDGVEKLIGRTYEGRLARAQRRILAAIRISGTFPHEEAGNLAEMITLQLLRVPRARAMIQDEALPGIVPPNFPVSRQDLAREYHLGVLADARSTPMRRIAGTISTFQLAVLRTSIERPFWTSDTPVLVGHQHLKTGRFSYAPNMGLAQLEAQVYFALAPDTVVALHRGTHPYAHGAVLEAASREQEWLNHLTYLNATNQVFGSRPLGIPSDWQTAPTK